MPNDQGPTELTEREKEILRLLATGTSNKDIARQLFISSNTVKVHLRNIFSKISVQSRTEAALYAIRMGTAEINQGPGVLKGAGDPTASQITASQAPARHFPIVRIVSVAAVIIILLAVVDLGFFLAQRKIALPLKNTQTPALSESRWQVLASLPTARSGMAVTTYENQVYAIGGNSSQGVTGVVERYDPSTNSWMELSPKPLPVTDVNAAVIGGKIYVPGGRTSSGVLTDMLEIYDPSQDNWGKGKNLPVAMSAYAMAAFEGRIYLFGGWDGKEYLNSVFRYDPTQDQWAVMTPMHEARGYAGAATAGDKIYVFGGYDGKQALATNEVFTPHLEGQKNPWEQVEALPSGLYDCGVASEADNIYIIGGQGNSKTFLAFLPQVNRWQKIDLPTQDIGTGLRLVQLGELLLVVGGQINNSPSALNLAYQAIYTVQIPLIINK